MYTAVLMLAMATSADTVDHGRRGGGCNGGYGGCSGYYGGCYGGGCYGGGYYGGGCCGGGGGYYRGYYNPGGYAYMNGGYYAPGYAYTNGGYQSTDVRQSFYSGPNQNTAMVQVILPNPDAEVWFDNAPTTQRGMDRFFQSPPLEGQGNYQYTIKAKWNQDGKAVEQERRVDLTPGRPVMVDFRAPQGERISDPNRQNPLPPNPNPKNPNPNPNENKKTDN